MGLIIHIGTGKTGTTSIQASLELNNSKLNKENIEYPATDDGEHNILEAAVLPFDKLHRVYRSRYANNHSQIVKESEEVCKNIKKSLSEFNHVIISGEYFLTLNKSSIIGILEKTGHDPEQKITVICYVRKPSSYWLSALQQRLKGSTTVDNVLERKYPFKSGLENWIDIVGKENVIVRPFDRNQLQNGDVVSDFYDQIYKITGSEINNPTLADEKNKSVSAEKSILMQELREELISLVDDTFTDESRKLMRLLNSNGNNLQQSRMKFHPRVSTFIDHHHAEDILWLEEQFGVVLPLPEPPNEESKAAAIRIFSEGRVRGLLTGYNQEILDKYRKVVVARFNEITE